MSKKWNMDIAWEKKSDYILRCIEESFGPSNGGSPMVTLKWEVAAPEEVEQSNGDTMVVAGIPLTSYHVLRAMRDSKTRSQEEQTVVFQDTFKKLLTAFELPTDNINWENPTLGFKGKTVYALLENEAKPQRSSPTKADLEKGIKEGPVLLNPKTKAPLVKNYPKIVEIYGIAELANSGAL